MSYKRGDKVRTHVRKQKQFDGREGWIVKKSRHADEWLVEFYSRKSAMGRTHEAHPNIGKSAFWFAPHEIEGVSPAHSTPLEGIR